MESTQREESMMRNLNKFCVCFQMLLMRLDHVLLKVDRDPDYLNGMIQSTWDMFIFYICPVVSNKAAVMQVINKNYGPFNRAFRSNLEFLSLKHLEANISSTLQS